VAAEGIGRELKPLIRRACALRHHAAIIEQDHRSQTTDRGKVGQQAGKIPGKHPPRFQRLAGASTGQAWIDSTGAARTRTLHDRLLPKYIAGDRWAPDERRTPSLTMSCLCPMKRHLTRTRAK